MATEIKNIQELDRLVVALGNAVTELESARASWGVWADTVRERVEQRLDRTYQENDPLVLADPEYGHALDQGTPVIEALESARRAFEQTRKMALESPRD